MDRENVWTIKSPKPRPKSPKPQDTEEKASSHPTRHPALAFSLSLILWGTGQIYNRQVKTGILLILLMVNFYAFLRIIFVHRRLLLNDVVMNPIGLSWILTAWGVFYLFGLVLWVANAVHAYRGAVRFNRRPFQGTENPVWPFLCSFMIPGWGQFLNGQIKKGVFFLSVSVIGLLALPAVITIYMQWSAFQTYSERIIWERVLLILLITGALPILIWPFNLLDAVKVSMDDVKKEPIRKRIEYANNLRRMKGWVHAYFPQAKLTLMLTLYLMLCVSYSYHYFPSDYYIRTLVKLEFRFTDQNMVLIPHIIRTVIKGESSKYLPQGPEKHRDPSEYDSLGV